MQLHFTQNIASVEDYLAEPSPFDEKMALFGARERIKALIMHLSRDVTGPTQWVTISHEITFYLSDHNSWKPEEANLFVSAMPYGFKIRYRSAKPWDHEKSFTVLEAYSMEEAGELIVKALGLVEKERLGFVGY